jgi:hypothetical protein
MGGLETTPLARWTLWTSEWERQEAGRGLESRAYLLPFLAPDPAAS